MVADVCAETRWAVGLGDECSAEKSGVCRRGRVLHLQGGGGHSDGFWERFVATCKILCAMREKPAGR